MCMYMHEVNPGCSEQIVFGGMDELCFAGMAEAMVWHSPPQWDQHLPFYVKIFYESDAFDDY